MEARRRVHAALLSRGFARDASAGIRGGWLYRGRLDPADLNVPVKILIGDWDFVEPPSMWIDPAYPVIDRRLPHFLGQNRLLCYMARGSIVLDRYDPAGTVLLCLDKAERLVRDALRGRLDAEFGDEFQAYWRGSWLLVDLPAGFTGMARLQSAQIVKGQDPPLVLSTGRTWLRGTGDKARRQPREDVVVLKVDTPLSLDPSGSWPPETLRAINEWLDWAAPSARGALESAISRSKHFHAHVALCAPNGIFLFDASLPIPYQTLEFKARRSGIPKLLSSREASVPVKRSEGKRADASYVFSRNFGSMKNLEGKRILLIGCGTIGGFLAQLLAQCGAGAGSGYLSLIDNGRLEPGNLGRHLLGAPYLGMNKADACAAFLQEQSPALAIEAYPKDILGMTSLVWARYNLVIDATGEEALSIALNQKAVERRPHGPAHLFAWLEGNGAVAQAILTHDAEHACYKCLKPDLAGQPRFRTLRDDVEIESVENASCGDTAYQPFPVSRSVAAAALACDLVLDWANDRLGARYRSTTLDGSRAFQVPRGSPKPHPLCPACARVT